MCLILTCGYWWLQLFYCSVYFHDSVNSLLFPVFFQVLHAVCLVSSNSLLHLFLTRLWPSPSRTHEQKDPGWQDQSPRPVAVAVLSAEWAEWTHMWLCSDCKKMGLDGSALLRRVRGAQTILLFVYKLNVTRGLPTPLPNTLAASDDLCRRSHIGLLLETMR